MKRNFVNLAVDGLAFCTVVWLTVTGLVLQWSLPPGSGRLSAAHGPVRVLWGMDRERWGQLHGLISYALMAVLALHLVLHWKWIVCTLQRVKSQTSGARWRLGLVVLSAFLALSLVPLVSPVQAIEFPPPAGQLTGRQLYEKHCLSCHGPQARGILPVPADERQAEAWLSAARPANAHAGLKSFSSQQRSAILTYLRTLPASHAK